MAKKRIAAQQKPVTIATNELELLRRRSEQLMAIEELNVKVRKAKIVYDRAKDKSLEAKKVWDGLTQDLSDIVNEAGDLDQGILPNMAAHELIQNRNDDKLLDTQLKKIPGLKPAQVKSLAGAGVEDLRGLERLRSGGSKDYPRGLSDVDFLGEAAITHIENCLVKFTGKSNAESETVTLSRDIPGGKKEGLKKGVRLAVCSREGGKIVVRSKSGKEFILNSADVGEAIVGKAVKKKTVKKKAVKKKAVKKKNKSRKRKSA